VGIRGGEGGKEDDENTPYLQVLAKAGKDAKDIPSDLMKALEEGTLASSALRKLWALEGGLFAPLLAVGPIRDRLLADPTFINKIAIDCFVGGCAQVFAEFQVRKDKFLAEADFVVAGVVTVLLGNFAAVYFAAPTLLPKAASTSSSSLVQFLSKCPDNAFQQLLAGQKPFSMLQRLGAIVKPMPQLFLVGLFSAAGGYAYTSASVAFRNWNTERKGGKVTGGASLSVETIGQISVAVGVYCAISTNGRYQVVAGLVEGRLIEKAFKSRLALQSAASTLVRTGNTYLGSYWIVEYLRFLGLQKVDDVKKTSK